VKNARFLILAAAPMEPSELNTIFSSSPDSIRRQLENPRRVRDAGWDLPRMTQAKFVEGEFIRTDERPRLLVDLYRDGTLLLLGNIYRDFLAWSDQSDTILHPLALTELIANFTLFYASVLEDFVKAPRRLKFRVDLLNMQLGHQKCRLGYGPVGTFKPHGTHLLEAPADNWNKEFDLPAQGFNPNRAAYRLLREIYLWFGHPEDVIAYTTCVDNETLIDLDQIRGTR
jgi:hypothetical protein